MKKVIVVSRQLCGQVKHGSYETWWQGSFQRTWYTRVWNGSLPALWSCYCMLVCKAAYIYIYLYLSIYLVTCIQVCSILSDVLFSFTKRYLNKTPQTILWFNENHIPNVCLTWRTGNCTQTTDELTWLEQCYLLYLHKDITTQIFISLLFVLQAGIYWVNLIDHFCAGWGILIAAVLEIIGIIYIYGKLFAFKIHDLTMPSGAPCT